MEKKFYILTEVGEYTPDQFIGKQWVKAFYKWELSEENEKKDNEFEKYRFNPGNIIYIDIDATF